MAEDSLHREILEEHARNPQFDHPITDPTHKADFKSTKTGNICNLTVKVEEGRLVKIGMKVQGSALATASASLLFSELNELTLEEAQHIHQGIFKTLLDGEINELPGDLCVYQSILHLPERHDCALLAWKALGEALAFQ